MMFFTFQGSYTCNAKYICEEILRRKLPWEIYWVTFDDGETFPPQVHPVRFRSAAYYKALAGTHILVDNAFGFVRSAFQKRPGQIYIETLHGSLGIKRIDPAAIPDKKRNARGYACGKATDWCISNSTFETEVFRTSFWQDSGIVELGHARNDLFFIGQKEQQKIRDKVREYYGIDQDCRLALYAPTFSQGIEREPIRADALCDALQKRFGGKWLMMERSHHRDAKQHKALPVEGSKTVDATDYPDIQELMIAVDFGITDYSSWIYDYVLTRKPGMIYAPDVEEYVNDRGFYYPITSTPFPVVTDNRTLCDAIARFDDDAYHAAVEDFLREKGCVDDGHASERIVDWLTQLMEKPC